jgi:hypothetical protein
MPEWFKGPVLKTGVSRGTVGSNPTPSAPIHKTQTKGNIMSEQRTNFMTAGAVVAIALGLIGWFSFSSDDTTEVVAENGVQAEQETIQVNNTETPDEAVEDKE